MAFPDQNITLANPMTGVFGNGQVQMFTSSGTFNVPIGVSKVRVRLWGGGGSHRGSAGGFALKEIDLGSVSSVAVVIGSGGTTDNSGTWSGGTTSFGAYVSATGGVGNGGTVGQGIGGDINYSGGRGGTSAEGCL